MRAFLIALVLVASAAHAETTCSFITPAEFAAALADPADAASWAVLSRYAARRHYVVSPNVQPAKCVIDGVVGYVVPLTNLRTQQADGASIRFSPALADSERLKLTIQKTPHTYIELGVAGGYYSVVADDGTVRKFKLLNGAAHLLHPPLTPSPTARRRL